MALTVGANTYVSMSRALSYLADRLYLDAWTDPKPATNRDRSLLMARRILDRQAWVGHRTAEDQLLAWPRSGVYDREGRVVDQDAVPQAIKDAQVELALVLLREDLTEDNPNRGVRRLKAGSVEIEYDGRAPARRLPDVVLELIEPFLATKSTSSSVRMVV